MIDLDSHRVVTPIQCNTYHTTATGVTGCVCPKLPVTASPHW